MAKTNRRQLDLLKRWQAPSDLPPRKHYQALIVPQPMASLVAYGFKRWLVLSWSTSWVGPVAICADRPSEAQGSPRNRGSAVGYQVLQNAGVPIEALPAAAVVAVCELAKVWRITDAAFFQPSDALLNEVDLDRFAVGRHVFELRRVARVDPPMPVNRALMRGNPAFTWRAPLDLRLVPVDDKPA